MVESLSNKQEALGVVLSSEDKVYYPYLQLAEGSAAQRSEDWVPRDEGGLGPRTMCLVMGNSLELIQHDTGQMCPK